MPAIHVDPAADERSRRAALYAGDLLVHRPLPSSVALCGFAREQIRQSFGDRDPERAQYDMPVQEYAALLAELKPRFIHHPETLRLVRAMLEELGYPADTTYFDLPRLRSSTSDGYLTTGIAYAFHAHRDTWYSAPMCQVNLWLPVYEMSAGNGMAFHPRYWDEPVPNDSEHYDYQRWIATNRHTAVAHVGSDTRFQPHAIGELPQEADLRVVTPVGGILQFSAAQLHSSVPNATGRTRFSIDLRVVNVEDLEAERGAPNLDSRCTGTSLPDFRRLSDLAPVDERLVRRYLDGHPQAARLAGQTA